jgi:hypothetical protein
MSAVVVKLPTAARRRVDNNRYASQRRAVGIARAAQPWPGEYVAGFVRDERRAAAAFARLERSPEMFALLAIMTAFPSDRLDALATASDMLLARDPDSKDGQTGHALISEAVKLRRAMETIAQQREG